MKSLLPVRSSTAAKLGLLTVVTMVVGLVCASPARAQAPLNCPAPGWNRIPYRISSDRFPTENVPSSTNYGNNTIYQWQEWFSGNVTYVYFEFGYFDTEANNDYLTIFGSATQTLTGQPFGAGAGGYSPQNTVLLTGSHGDNYVNMFWVTNGSIARPGWRIDAAWVYCGWTNETAKPNTISSQLYNNSQRDGVLLGTHDIRYFTTIQKANSPLFIHLKPDDGPWNSQDFDLYASTLTSVPNPTGYQWYSAQGGTVGGKMKEDAIYIPAVGADRYVNFSVYSYTGSGGYRVYANNIGRTRQLKVGTDTNYKSPTNYTATIVAALQATSGGFYAANDGTALIDRWDIYNNVVTPNNNSFLTACGGQKCDFVLWSGANVNQCSNGTAVAVCSASGAYPCGISGANFIGDCTLIPGGYPSAGWGGLVLTHELGHCEYGLTPDEYNIPPPGDHDGHSIMATAVPGGGKRYDYCSDWNHLKDSYLPNSVTQFPNSGWDHIKTCFPGQVANRYISGTPDPETWQTSPIWTYSGYPVSIYEH